MARVLVLPQIVADKIAAGEVIERPASAVKELVENSLDAGATSISVEVENSGRKLIRISDDGMGMNREDALTSIKRHATSKIQSEADLFRINSLGFRGEALASIASVSRFELVTREKGALSGVSIKVNGGVVEKVEDAAAAPGTVVSIKDLFYNTPARLKFLKRPATELNHITDFVTRIALSNHEIRFSLTHNGGEIFTLGKAPEPTARILEALGSSASDALRPVSYNTSEIKLEGWVSSEALTRSTSNAFYTYVNGRFIRDRTINHAILNAYNTLVPKGRYPVVVLFITMDPESVDVNVHPTKAEVRFSNASIVHEAIRRGIGGAFHSGPPAASVFRTPDRSNMRSEEKVGSRPSRQADSARRGVSKALDTYMDRNTDRQEPRTYGPLPEVDKADTYDSGHSHHGESDVPVSNESDPFTQGQSEIPIAGGHYAAMRPIGQVKNSFILCESRDGLILIDQHAAHERTVFDQLKKALETRKVESQLLLLPETIELSASEAGQMQEHLEEIVSLGFDIEAFGRSAFVVRSVPALLSNAGIRDMLMDVLDGFTSPGEDDSIFKSRMDEVLARLACHAVVRANRELSLSEIKALLNLLDNADMPHTCPHGRPISIKVSIEEIEKMFRRK